jgi:hypothetical protein
MAFRPIKHKGKHLKLHRAIRDPDFNSKVVLATDTWNYVQMWLASNHQLKDSSRKEALFHWEQAKQFYNASLSLPQTSSPLTAYYAVMNATKALLIVKGVQYSDRHGVEGNNDTNAKASLSNVEVTYKSQGILSGLCNFLREDTSGTYTLKDILYNLPCVHRAFILTFTSQRELFIPIEKPMFVRKNGSTESWLNAEIKNKKYANKQTLKKLPGCFERDLGIHDKFVIRVKDRFEWKQGDTNNLIRLTNYHRKIRRHLLYIHGKSVLWYVKRDGEIDGLINRSCLTLRFAALHRLSELARYHPALLSRHFKAKHNWLLSEFIARSLHQYIDEISCEMTGKEILVPGYR